MLVVEDDTVPLFCDPTEVVEEGEKDRCFCCCCRGLEVIWNCTLLAEARRGG